ncbi:ABC transporter ATP-binding protein [Aureivirga sp. CE67]|uniref:ABC transporter ATP-binding protein n=1 Tax=Aureivirga sp. CE67 TaxID=1788983 RepID=UPI0018C9A579|nr:ATP-binding cassette domain-containing protein [Aureivirga sp. CE67]
MSYTIETKNLCFSFNSKQQILKNISLHVPKGSIFGFLGQNGAGKSTTMRLLAGLIYDGTDSIYLFEKKQKKQTPTVFKKIGCLIEIPILYYHLSAYDNLKYFAKLQRIPKNKIPEILEIVSLDIKSKKKVKNFSLGMKQRLAIGIALLNDPELLLLDEPVNGLDPAGIIEIRNLLIKLNKEKGITIFISSHMLDEVEKMCTHLGIIHHGEMVFQGTMGEFQLQNQNIQLHLEIENPKKWFSILEKEAISIYLENEKYLQCHFKSKTEIPDFIEKHTKNGMRIYQAKIQDSLEKNFMEILQN